MSTAIEIPKKPNDSEIVYVPKPTPMDLLRLAVSQNLDIDKLQKLMELQLKWEANEARKAYVEAMNAFKTNPPRILKDRHVKFGQTEYDHASLDGVCKAVIEALSHHGITHRWTVAQDAALIRVTCILTHEKGHSEETTLQGPPDASGSKNAIQQVASTVTYLERYTLLAATGLSAGNDTDGNSEVNNGWVAERIKEINDCRDQNYLGEVFNKAYAEAKKNRNAQAILLLIEARDEQRKKLG